MRFTRYLALIAAVVALAIWLQRTTGKARGETGRDPQREGAYVQSPDSRAFSAFVDEYLDEWAAFNPSIAAGNGLHMHDDRLEDFTLEGIAREVAWFHEMKARLAQLPSGSLTPDERVDHRILDGIIDGWLLDLEVARNWSRNPMIYASALADGVHGLMTMESASPQERMRRIRHKLRGVPELADAMRTNMRNPPRVLVERGIAMFEGAASMLDVDLERAFPGPRGETRNDMRREARRASETVRALVAWMRSDLLPRSGGNIALGGDYLTARYRAEELIDTPLDTMLAIGTSELASEKAEFVAKARAVDPKRDALAVWADILRDHPARGQLVDATRRTVEELQEFVVSKGLVDLPNDEHVVVEPSLPFDIGLASMHASPPLEKTPVKSIFYVTDADSTWPPERQEKWLEHYNYPSLAITASHEAMPGHFVHSLFMRQTPGKIRRIWIGLNPFPQPSSGQDGWAHYAEHLIIEQGFKADDPRYAMAQLSESMTRICRLIGGIGVHTKGWTVEQAAQFFEKEAHVPGPAAMQEAIRLTYDPTNGGYFLGKRALLALRHDYRERLGSAFTLKEFHARVMRNGIAPWWAHRQLMLPGDDRAVVR